MLLPSLSNFKCNSPPLSLGQGRKTSLSFGEQIRKFEPCPLSLCVSPPVSTPQPSLSLFYQHPQSSHLQGGSSAFAELNFLVIFFRIFFLFLFCIFSRSGNGLAVFRGIELWMFLHNCAKHSHMQLSISPPYFQACENGMKLTCSKVICMSQVHHDVYLLLGLVESYVFHGACFRAALIDPRWAVSELSAAPTEPTEIGFLLALEHCYVKGTTAQPKHTPSSRWLLSETQRAPCT